MLTQWDFWFILNKNNPASPGRLAIDCK